MEDLVWIVVAVIGLIVSVASKAMKQQQGGGRPQSGPQWPGPVAGPRPGQGPTWAPAPGQRPTLAPAPKPQAQAPRKAETVAQARPQPAKTLVSGDVFSRSLDAEGYGSEGIGSEGYGTEGPGPTDGVDEEMNRFSRESEQFERRELNRITDHLGRSEAAAVVTAYESTSADVQAALGGADSLARAIVLSEVLGKPKALRRRVVR